MNAAERAGTPGLYPGDIDVADARAAVTFHNRCHPQILVDLEVDAPILPCLETKLAEAGIGLRDFWAFFGVKPLRACHTPS